ncbi:MAG TPA: hypothetical protein VHP33_09650 [Polyangiaceae bacterium]|nr:hypothetical protein [Polyangiaceae bacterium]
MTLRALALLGALWLAACSDGASSSSSTGAGAAAGMGGSVASLAGAGGGAGGQGGGSSNAGSSASGGASTGGAAGATPMGGAGGSASGGAAAQAGAAGAGGGPVVDPGPVKHHVMAIEYPGRLVEISDTGQKLWEHQTPSLTVMFNVLPNGNVFFPHGGDKRGAQEVDKQHQVVWSYTSPAAELLGGERLANGNSLLGEGGPAKALELDPAKAEVRSIAVTTTETAAHGQIRHIHRLANGNVLLALEGEGVAREVDAAGKMVWEYEGVPRIHEAIRLPAGNTLIGGGDAKRVLEVTPAGQVAWEFGAADAPELGIAFIASVQVLKNGDLLVCNWLGANGGNGVHAFQVTRAKKVVWKLDDHQLLKSATTVTALDD